MPLVGSKIELTSDDFGHRVRKNYLLVDKTLMIKEFIEGQDVSLITRPRRFGKTLNMSMLYHFFASEVGGESTKNLFENFAIAKEVDAKGARYMDTHQGQYPVICITFKDVKESAFDKAVQKIQSLIEKLYREHQSCLDSVKLTHADKTNFDKYMTGRVNEAQLAEALSYLSEFLHKVYDKKVIILIDEYDSPLTSAYEHGYLDELSDFMRGMLSSALKSNIHLEKGLMTGILRVSQSSMLSGLNNLKVYTLLNEKYEQYFGFTEDEVSELMSHLEISESLENIRGFYNGYTIGDTVIYNPWSLMNYVEEKKLEAYWVLTSNDTLLKKLLLQNSDEAKDKLSQLIAGDAIEAPIKINLRYDELMEKPDTLWTILLFCGYLTVESIRFEEEDDPIYTLKIPNREVGKQYKTVFTGWLKEAMGSNNYVAFLNDLVEGRIAVFIQKLTGYLLSCTSSKDFRNESNYHTFILGLLSGMTGTHYVFSNKEAGLGFPDMTLIPRDTNKTRGFILEFKYVNPKKQHPDDHLELDYVLKDSRLAVIEALNQINSRAYASYFLAYPHIKEVIKIGIGFANRCVSAGSITTPIEAIREASPVLTEEDITFYDAHDEDDSAARKRPREAGSEDTGIAEPKKHRGEDSRLVDLGSHSLFASSSSSSSSSIPYPHPSSSGESSDEG